MDGTLCYMPIRAQALCSKINEQIGRTILILAHARCLVHVLVSTCSMPVQYLRLVCSPCYPLHSRRVPIITAGNPAKIGKRGCM
jgi:hypothetical protein